MTVLNKIAYYQGRRDEGPNQELARELVETGNLDGIAEILENLDHKDVNVQSDCIKVLYEIGYLNPELICGFAGEFIKLTKSRHNRLVWGAMLALSTVANLAADEIYAHRATIIKAMEEGSVITVDNGVKVLAEVASKNELFSKEIFPYLLHHLRTCRPKDVPQHAEHCQAAVTPQNKTDFIDVLNNRSGDLTGAQMERVQKVIKQIERN